MGDDGHQEYGPASTDTYENGIATPNGTGMRLCSVDTPEVISEDGVNSENDASVSGRSKGIGLSRLELCSRALRRYLVSPQHDEPWSTYNRRFDQVDAPNTTVDVTDIAQLEL